MSSNTIILNTGQQAIINTDLTKIFVWNNRYDSARFTNDTDDDVNLVAGTLLGKISATQDVVPLVASATDGSQFPVGILAEDAVILANTSAQLSYCVAGDVVEGKVILATGNTMSTVISGRSIHDRIGGDTVGVKLVGGIENTDFDNS